MNGDIERGANYPAWINIGAMTAQEYLAYRRNLSTYLFNRLSGAEFEYLLSLYDDARRGIVGGQYDGVVPAPQWRRFFEGR